MKKSIKKRLSSIFLIALLVITLSLTGCSNKGVSYVTEAPAEQSGTATQEPTPAEKPEPTPTEQPVAAPIEQPTEASTEQPVTAPTLQPTASPDELPELTPQPTSTPTEQPVPKPTPKGMSLFGQSVVSIVQSDNVKKAEELTQEDIYNLVKQAVTYAGGLEGIVKDGDVVVLKPNLVTANDYTLPGWRGKALTKEVNGNCTDYRFVRAAAQVIREINPAGKIYVMEGSAQDTEKVMDRLNYTREYIPEVDAFYAIENVSGGFRDTAAKELVEVKLPNGFLHDTYYINRQIYEADAFICLPTLKNHWDAGITGSIKNISIGSTPANIYGKSQTSHGRNGMVDHATMDLHKWIADFFTARPADFTITDGLQGLENGPTPSFEIDGSTDIKDSQKNMRLVLAGKDAVAVDTVSAHIMNWDYTTIPYLNYLNDIKVGTTDTQKITVVGNRKVADVRTDFEGRNPPVAGKKLTDKTGPTLENVTAVLNGNTLNVTHTTNSDCVKTEIYANNVLVGQALNNAPASEIDASGFADGEYEIKVIAYDKFMNQTVKTTTVIKE